ncbi:MAG TPA: sigma-70 family RNA polymerase sigma factor [Gemmatimonadaceae bacterium]|nr:sigma-70 family RNA polymerase sigma factor [Gemmatimonadaceae bacterium]
MNAAADASIGALIAQARDGSSDALASLYREHAEAMMAVAYRLLMSRPDAEDVVHDVFVGLPEALRKYEERGSFASWIKRVTVRVALSRLRAERRTTDIDHASEAHATARDVVTHVALRDAIASLSPALRAVLVLKEIEGFSHADIAGMLGISVAASEVRLHRALRALRTILRDDR